MRETDDPDYGLPEGVSKDDFLAEVRARFKLADEAVRTEYRQAEDDMKFAFVPDHQWDDWMTRARGKRPRYTFNKVRQALKQVTNDQRQNRPQPKVRAVGDTDKAYAEVREGIFRSIERHSNADRAYDTAFQYAVGGGFGVWRITTDYSDDGAFDQDIFINEVPNPYSVLFDPAAKSKDRRDARYAFFVDRIPRSVYGKRWKHADIDNFVGMDDAASWYDTDTVRVCEYWYKVAVKKTIIKLSDGRTLNRKDVEALLDEWAAIGITVVAEREVEVDEVRQCLIDGAHILEKPSVWAGKFIPFVPTWGDILNLDGKDTFCGMVAFTKDAQRCYNYERSIFIEIIAKQPKSPLMATPKMIEGFENQYARIGVDDPPVLMFNVDENAPGGRPSREQPPAFPGALAQAAQISNDDIKSTTGKYDASLGARSNETSGKAILARQREGDVSSFDYIDNLAYAQKYSYEIINDLIPKIYDTPRQIRIIGEDSSEKVLAVNQPVLDQATGQWIEVNDFEKGRFDIGVTVGPSFTTQRMEAADALMQLSNDPSPLGMIAKFGFLKSLDAPGMDELLKGARKFMVTQGLLEAGEEDGPPPEPPGPNPKDMADVKLKDAQAKKAIADAEQTETETQRMIAMDQFALGETPIPTEIPGMPPVPMQPEPAQAGFLLPDVFPPQ